MSAFADIATHGGFVAEEENVAAMWKKINAMHAQNKMAEER